MSKDEIGGVAWALLYPTGDEVMVMALVGDTLIRQRDGVWSADVYGRKRSQDAMALMITSEAEAAGMMLVAGPVSVTVPSSTFSDYGFVAKVAMIRLWKYLHKYPSHPEGDRIKRAMNNADGRIGKPESWDPSTGVGVH